MLRIIFTLFAFLILLPGVESRAQNESAVPEESDSSAVVNEGEVTDEEIAAEKQGAEPEKPAFLLNNANEKVDQLVIPDAAPENGGEVTEQKKTDIVILDEKSLPWTKSTEPKKTEHNILRIKFDPEQIEMTGDDKIALNAMIKLAQEKNIEKITVKSFSSKLSTAQKERQKGLSRVLKLRKALSEMGFDLSRAAFVINSNVNNKENLDYIDIDKI